MHSNCLHLKVNSALSLLHKTHDSQVPLREFRAYFNSLKLLMDISKNLENFQEAKNLPGDQDCILFLSRIINNQINPSDDLPMTEIGEIYATPPSLLKTNHNTY